VVLLVAAPARVWLHAAYVSAGDAAVPPGLRLLWAFAGLLPATVGVAAWLAYRSRSNRHRFVLAAIWACSVGLATMLPISMYVFAF
jgi:hypothetical protein